MAKSHKAIIRERIIENSACISTLLEITEEQLFDLKHNWASEWFKSHKVPVNIARNHLFSPTFFNWWFQQLMLVEDRLLEPLIGAAFYDYLEVINKEQVLCEYIGIVLELRCSPNEKLFNKIKSESIRAMKNNPDLKQLKIY